MGRGITLPHIFRKRQKPMHRLPSPFPATYLSLPPPPPATARAAQSRENRAKLPPSWSSKGRRDVNAYGRGKEEERAELRSKWDGDMLIEGWGYEERVEFPFLFRTERLNSI